ncbi:hypothetical protein C8J57DRAFT_1467928 [Mycena rebaudengoi]|nr:hypothetical protein C8J57DRAFT_1467928 [Mycena rebaudengoi]
MRPAPAVESPGRGPSVSKRGKTCALRRVQELKLDTPTRNQMRIAQRNNPCHETTSQSRPGHKKNGHAEIKKEGHAPENANIPLRFRVQCAPLLRAPARLRQRLLTLRFSPLLLRLPRGALWRGLEHEAEAEAEVVHRAVSTSVAAEKVIEDEVEADADTSSLREIRAVGRAAAGGQRPRPQSCPVRGELVRVLGVFGVRGFSVLELPQRRLSEGEASGEACGLERRDILAQGTQYLHSPESWQVTFGHGTEKKGVFSPKWLRPDSNEFNSQCIHIHRITYREE